MLKELIKNVFPICAQTMGKINFTGKVIDFSYRPKNQGWTGCMGKSEQEFTLYGVNNQGIKKIASRFGGKFGSNYAYVDTQEFEGQSILEALKASKYNEDTFEYLIIHEYVYSNWDGQEIEEYTRSNVYSTK